MPKAPTLDLRPDLVRLASSARRAECVSPASIRMPTSPDFGALSGSLVNHSRWSPTETGHRYQHRHGGEVTVWLREGETAGDLFDRLISQQGIDSIFVLALCLTGLLPAIPIDPAASLTARFELTDVARRCGLLTDTRVETRLRAVEKVWRAIEAGERYVVETTREMHVGRKKVARPVSAALWRINDVTGWGPGELPADLPMMDAAGFAYVLPPSSAELTLSSTFAECFGITGFAQFVSGTDTLASIPAGQTWGKIARALGLRVLFVARLSASRGLAASDIAAFMRDEEPSALPALSRREWITASGGPNPDAVAPNNRPRYRKAYYVACRELATTSEKGREEGREVLALYGDAAPGAEAANASKRWDAWLSEPVRFVPGARFWPQLRELARRSGFVTTDTVARQVLNGRGRPRAPRVRTGGPGFLHAYRVASA